MNNVLIVTPQNILPPSDGGKLCMYSHIVALCNEGNKIYLAMGNTNVDTEVVYPEVMRYLSDYIVLPRESVEIKKASFTTRIFEVIRWFFSGKPRQAHTLESKTNKKILMEFVREKKIDVIILETIFSSELLDFEWCKNKNVRLVVVEHNVEYNFIKDCLFEMKIPAWVEAARVKKYEKDILCNADLVVTISPKDAEVLGNDFEIDGIKYLPALLPQMTDVWRNSDSDYVIFGGSLTFYPNYYSIMWFLKNIWNEFSQIYPHLKLKITGGNTEKIKDEISGYPNVMFTGFLEEDEYHLLKTNALFEIIPIIMGSGIKIKLLEALSMGIPVIATTHCYEGIPYNSDDNPYYVANNDREFLQAMKTFVSDKQLRIQYSKNGIKFYNEIYASETNRNKWLDILRKSD